MDVRNFFMPFSLLCAIAFGSCSVDTGNSNGVDQTNVFGDYLVYKKSNEDQVKVLTWFRYAGQTGTTLRLTENATITANEQKMNLVEGRSQILNFTGSYYTQSFASSLQTNEYAIVWTRNDGQVFRNVIPAPRPIEALVLVDGVNDFTRAGETANISIAKGGFQVTYEGADLAPDEHIDCTLSSDVEQRDPKFTYFLTGKWNATLKHCLFSKDALQKFQLGAASLKVIREWRQENKAKGHERAGSYMTSFFEALPIACEILP